MALSDTVIRNLKPEGRRRERLVADTNGLYLRLRVGATGKIARTWQYRRKDDGVVHITTLGGYPTVTLKVARLKAAEMAAKGITFSPTVAEIADQWHREVVEKTHKEADRVRWYLDRAMRDIGTMRAADVRPRDIATVVRSHKESVANTARAKVGGSRTARRLLSTLKTMFKYAVSVGAIDTSPAAQITGAVVGAAERARDRVLTDDEIRWVMTSDMPQASVWRFLLATAVRVGESYSGHRDGQFWVVPAEKSKNGKAHRVHLSALALTQLKAQPWPPMWATQMALSTLRVGWTCHDIRRTVATKINDMGIAPPWVVEKLLNHSLGGMMAVYNQAEYARERQQALEQWCDWLQRLVETQPAEVVSLRARAL